MVTKTDTSTRKPGEGRQVQYKDAVGKHTRTVYDNDMSASPPQGATEIREIPNAVPNTAPNSAVVNAPNASPVAPTGTLAADTSITSPEAQQAFQKGYVKSPEEYTGAVQSGQDLASRYKQGLVNIKSSGIPAPDTQGQAGGAINGAVPPPATDMSAVDLALSEDDGFKGLQEMYNDYFHPEKQKKSLVDEYKKLYKNSGLDELDEEILDAKTIIEGTEDDIRNEIQQAGGFGTDSQVQALASARNKTLLKNYNNLVAMREMKEKNFDTLVNLTEKDREYADQKAEQMLDFQFKVMDYKDKFVQNTKDNLNKMLDRDPIALYASYSKDPRQMAFAEQILGLGSGGLQQVAQNYATEKQQKLEDDNLDRKYKQAQISNVYSQISDRNNVGNPEGTLNGKPQNASQSSANGYADRLGQADIILAGLGNKFTGKSAIGGYLPNILQSKDRQVFEQAKKNFSTAVLRRESGATISPSEFKTVEEAYFPQAGDKADVLTSKENLRNTVINNFYREANVARPVLPGMVVHANGTTYKVDVDGETLIEQ